MFLWSMDLIDSKYINLISSRLQKFKKVKPNLYNFRCPICGDSQKYKNKARGYIYTVKSNTNFKCHNCGSSMSLNNFLKKLDGVLHKRYSIEKFKEGFTGKSFVIEEPEFNFKKPEFKTSISLPKCTESVIAREYLKSRKIDANAFYFAKEFKKFVNTLKPTFKDTKNDEPRIIIPLWYKNNLIGFQGRSIYPNKIKYITIMLDEEAPKIYGLDSIDQKLPIYVVEGPFDSTFLSNSVALCGSDGNMDCLKGSDLIFVYDNEPRNKEIVSRIEQTIQRGERVVIWPKNIFQKDINDMILAGVNVHTMLKSNIYSGLEAKVKFTEWKKI